MSELISCHHVGYQQQGVDILCDVDWRIERGEHWAVLGPNGCGKTTLLRIASGYLWPISGHVLRLGKELIDLGELRRSIAWISGDLANRIPSEDTGLETVVTGRLGMIGLKHLPFNKPTSQDFSDAAAELARLGCESLADKPFGVLSQGERQQVLVARARIIGPLLLVLDEPCAGMDPGVRERFLHWLNTCVATPETPAVIFVTHHIEEIMPGIERTLILRNGRVHAAGPTHAVVSRETIEEVYDTRLARIESSAGRLWPIWGE
ncbi:MAG: ABC transporter ATP-binding protein [Pirellulales bacterium]